MGGPFWAKFPHLVTKKKGGLPILQMISLIKMAQGTIFQGEKS
jgi:hypothetical protein